MKTKLSTWKPWIKIFGIILTPLMILSILPNSGAKAISYDANPKVTDSISKKAKQNSQVIVNLPVIPNDISTSDNTDTIRNGNDANNTRLPILPNDLSGLVGISSESANTTLLATPDNDNQLTSSSGKIALMVPKGAINSPTEIQLSEKQPYRNTGSAFLQLFELNASDQATDTKVSQFNKQLTITIKNDPSDLRGLDTDTLKLYYLDEKTNQWQPVTSSKYDPKSGILTATTQHFSLYGEQANPLANGPGRVMAAQVGLVSGTATYSYPFELPPGPGGFQPKLELTYNSGIADEMKNKRDLGSWVGIGWTLNLGRISVDLASGRYYLELNGASYELLSSDGTNFNVVPDAHFKVTRSEDELTWHLYDNSGNYYRFGGTSDSEQYVNGDTYYRWDLSRITDPNGNQANVTYVRDIIGTSPNDTVRSAYPQTLSYNNNKVQITFNSNHDLNDPTEGYAIRYDNPKTTSANPAPRIMENRYLDSIEIKVDNNLIRKYAFAYNHTNSTQSSDYGGIYYSGTYTLSSVTQLGNDGSTSLPPTGFGYTPKETYINDTSAATYTGNPGNSATFNWPHLTSISSGYGGTISYNYTEYPSSGTTNIWTREVVTQKTVNPGTGTTMTDTYTYTGGPQYFYNDGNAWEAKFRGFSLVRDTDGTGNYVDHYFNTVDSSNDAIEKLTGLETKTEWHASDGTLIKKVENQWSWSSTANSYGFLRTWGGWYPIGWFKNPTRVAVSSDGYLYVADTNNNRIQKFTSSGTFVTQWGSFGEGPGDFNDPVAIAVGSDGSVYVVDNSNYRVQKFNGNGNFITEWGSEGSGNGQLDDPRGITVGADGYVYVVEAGNSRVQRFSLSGSYDTQWGTEGSGNGQFEDPQDITVGSDGYVYVADTGNDRIEKFSSTGTFSLTWGSSGSGDGRFYTPTGIGASSDGHIYVADTENNRIQQFNTSGVYEGKWGSEGSIDGRFEEPEGVAVGNDGSIYVADTQNRRIQKFNSSKTFVIKWGQAAGSNDGQFDTPQGIALGSDGFVYVADTYNNRIQKFQKTGSFVAKWGSEGTSNGKFNTPQGIAVDGDGNIYVIDTGNNRVQKFSSIGTYLAKWGSYGTGNGQFKNPCGIAVGSDGYIYVADTNNNRIQKFYSSGALKTKWGTQGSGNGQLNHPQGVSVGTDGNIYVIDTGNNRVEKFSDTGTYIGQWGSSGESTGQFDQPCGISAGPDGNIYVADTNNGRIQKFDTSGTFLAQWGLKGDGEDNFNMAVGLTVGSDGYVYIADSDNNRICKYQRSYSIALSETDQTTGNKVTRTCYAYDSYGNVITQYNYGDNSTSADDSTIWRVFNASTSANILNKPSRERVYSGIKTSDDGSSLKKETDYNYDNQANGTPPTKGNLTGSVQWLDATHSITSSYAYDSYGNKTSEIDPNSKQTSWTYDGTYHTYPATKTYPALSGVSFTESFTYDAGTSNLLTQTDINGQETTYQYDALKRLTSVNKPLGANPDITYSYTSWGTLNQQCIYTRTYFDASTYTWERQFFDGLGRVIQVQDQGEPSTSHSIISSTTIFDNRGLVDKQYVSQDLPSIPTTYTSPDGSWKYTSYVYDVLGRVTTQTNADTTTINNSYSTTDWINLVTNERGYKTRYYYDAFQRLVKVEELDTNQQVYSTTIYSYDILGNLLQVLDNAGNTTTMTYNWLSQKTAMSDPDMGSWGYTYDNNGNLLTQTDAKNQTINYSYDALNRLTGKTYPQGSGMTNVTYAYDNTTGSNYGKGRRTAMTDASGSTSYIYDARGRMIQETRSITGTGAGNYVTQYGYDGADRNTTIVYPTGETVTQGYSGRSLPKTLTGSVAGNLVTSTSYNQLGEITQINLGNGLQTVYTYWALDHGTTSYGKPWEIKTSLPNGSNVIQDVTHTWDAGGNLTQRDTYGSQSSQSDTTAPAAVSNLAVNSPTSTSLMVSWTAPGDDGSTGTATQYDIRFSTSAINAGNWASAIEATAEPAPQTPGTNQSMVVNGLNPNTTYYFAMKTADEAYNWSTISNCPSGTTSAASDTTPPSAVNNLSAGTPTVNSLTVSWTAPGDDGSNGTATQYDIRFSTSAINAGNWASAIEATAEPAPLISGTNQSFIVSGLNANTTYYFAMKTADEAYNWSTISNCPSGTTSSGGGTPVEMTITLSSSYDDGYSGSGAFERTVDYYEIGKPSSNTIHNTWFRFIGITIPAGATIEAAHLSLVQGGFPTETILRIFADDSGNPAAPTSQADHVSKVRTTAYTDWTIGFGDWNYHDTPDFTSVIQELINSYTYSSGAIQILVDDNGSSQTKYAQGSTYEDGSDNRPKLYIRYHTGSGSDTTPPAAVSNLAAGTPTSTSLTVSWTAPWDDGSTGTATRYDIRYSASAITSGNWASASQAAGEPLPLANGNNQSFVVPGLSPSTTYYFAIKTADEALNWSSISNCPSSTTSAAGGSDTTPPAAVSNLGAGTPTSTSLTVSWTAPGDDGSTGTATRYDIRYSTSAITSGNWASASQAAGEPLPLANGNNQSFVVPGLSPSTTYYFVIKTADEALNWSSISNCPSSTTSAAGGGGGNETEVFGYDFLDRLTTVTGAYSENYTYNQIGNLMSHNGVAYTYPTNGVRPHAVTSVGSTSYAYDANGNMYTRGSQTLTWDVENQVTAVSGGASYIYDGDGNRIKKTENGQTVLYINKYYEYNLTSGNITTYYYLGGKLVAERTATTLQYLHQDILSGTSAASSSAGAAAGSIKYLPFGETRNSQGTIGTDKLFTGQRLDNTGLYYYGARYYDPTMGRFISPDTIVQDPGNPQSLNRYSYCLNNPLKYIDPTGHLTDQEYYDAMVLYGIAPSTNPIDTPQLQQNNLLPNSTISPTPGVSITECTDFTLTGEKPFTITAYEAGWEAGQVTVVPYVNIGKDRVSVDLVGYYKDEGSDIIDAIYITPNSATLNYETNKREKGSVPLDNMLVVDEAFTNVGMQDNSFDVILYSSNEYNIPTILDCRKMSLTINFVGQGSLSYDWDLNQTPFIISPVNYTIMIKNLGISWWQR